MRLSWFGQAVRQDVFGERTSVGSIPRVGSPFLFESFLLLFEDTVFYPTLSLTVNETLTTDLIAAHHNGERVILVMPEQ